MPFRDGKRSRAALEGAPGEHGGAPGEHGGAPREHERASREQRGAPGEHCGVASEQKGAHGGAPGEYRGSTGAQQKERFWLLGEPDLAAHYSAIAGPVIYSAVLPGLACYYLHSYSFSGS